ncbi:MAG TPA: LLM class F420-dependent oxidoreductase [Gaiellaceae bacterium]
MRLGFYMGYAPPGTSPLDLIELARTAETIGYDSAWAAEAWGTDAITPLAWLGALTERIKLGTAIMQIPGRSPANAAMTAATLDLLSGGRFLMGIGTSGPQVVEGWHGQEWGKPLGKTREYVEIVRAALRRERLEHHGAHYDIPVQGGTGLGKPLKLMARPLRSEIPIYLASIGPKAVELAFEIADGWLPIFWSPEKARSVFPLDRAREGFEIAPSVPAVLTDDVASGREVLKEYYSFYIGGMGARGKNFYNDLFTRYGYESEAREIQDLFLEGKQREAAAKVPDAFVDEVALVGPVERMRDRLAAWRESGVTTMLVSTRDEATLRAVAEAAG